MQTLKLFRNNDLSFAAEDQAAVDNMVRVVKSGERKGTIQLKKRRKCCCIKETIREHVTRLALKFRKTNPVGNDRLGQARKNFSNVNESSQSEREEIGQGQASMKRIMRKLQLLDLALQERPFDPAGNDDFAYRLSVNDSIGSSPRGSMRFDEPKLKEQSEKNSKSKETGAAARMEAKAIYARVHPATASSIRAQAPEDGYIADSDAGASTKRN